METMEFPARDPIHFLGYCTYCGGRIQIQGGPTLSDAERETARRSHAMGCRPHLLGSPQQRWNSLLASTIAADKAYQAVQLRTVVQVAVVALSAIAWIVAGAVLDQPWFLACGGGTMIVALLNARELGRLPETADARP